MVFGRILDFLDLILVNEEFFVNAEDFPLPEEVIDAKMWAISLEGKLVYSLLVEIPPSD